MKILPLAIQGAWLIHSEIHTDDRGHFREWFRNEEFPDLPKFEVKQANTSISNLGVIRGLHFSSEQNGQSKFVTCTSGSVLDAIVDLRPLSSTFGESVVVELDSRSGTSVFISKGLGHGFQALENQSVVTYLLDSKFDPEKEFNIYPLDSVISIPWKNIKPILSPKDRNAPKLMDFNFLEMRQND
jgi:dTDP-4-dehydrorhamnose 3,5-epimerase